MSYNPLTDFLALLRQTGAGVRTERMPGLDYIIAALARAGQFAVVVGQTAPTSNQQTTVWLKPGGLSANAESVVYLFNTGTGVYEIATPALWAILIPGIVTQVTQDVNAAGPVAVLPSANVVRVLNVGAPVTLVMPAANTKVGGVLISDWANLAGTNNITIQRTGLDVFPNGATSLTIAGDGGSLFLRPVVGGYVI